MPLLGKKIFDSGIPSPKDVGSSDEYVIGHSKEVFHSETEYKDRLSLYEKQIWTCQCTGHASLTHKEATLSERACRERLSRTFPQVWEESILMLVHHSFSPLDNIVGQAHYTLMTKFVPNEKVLFTVAKHGKSFDATIVHGYEEDTSSSESSNEKNDDESSFKDIAGSSTPSISPSSDKENKGRQTLITDIFKSDNRRSPRSTTSQLGIIDCAASKGKRLKLLPAKYDILLVNENKIVSKVPSEHLTRVQKPPNREQIRLFIRANAVRPYANKEKLPWIVDEDMVFRYTLKPHISPEEEKRMVQGATITAKQYVKELNKPSVNPHSLMNGHGPSNGDCEKSDKNETENEPILIEDKSSSPSSPASKLAPIFSAKKRKLTAGSPEAEDNKRIKSDLVKTPADSISGQKQLSKKNKLSGMEMFMKKYGSPSSSVKNNNQEKQRHKSPKDISKKKTTKRKSLTITDPKASKKKNASSPQKLVLKKQERPGSSRKNSSPKKKKQATLLELTKKGSIKVMASPSLKRSESAKPRKPRQPLIVLQLLSLKKEKKFRPHKYKMTVTAACKMLTDKQRDSLPDEVRDDILKKYELEEKKKKFQAMSQEEKRAFLAEQRKAKREALGVAGQTRKQEKFEDLHLDRTGSAKRLPDVDLVVLPENLPNTTFGDIAMLCEFLHSYHMLLSPKDGSFHKQFNICSITEAVTAGRNGFGLTRKILVLLLQTLLADDIARDYTEVEYHLNQILVTPEMSCEMTRICLRQHDEEPDDVKSESSSNADNVDTGLSDSTSRRLFELELYEMNPAEQVEVLSTLAYRVMNTYAVQLHMEDTMTKATTLWNKVVQRKKEKKQEMKEKGIVESPKKRGPKPKESEHNGTHEEGSLNGSKVEETEEMLNDIDLVSRVKRRKMLSEQHRKEEEERKRKLREEQDKLAAEQRNRQEMEKADKQLVETRMLARHVRRRIPLGTDRNHSRYWLFCDGVPGLYVEKGWVNDYVDYTTKPGVEQEPPLSPLKSPSSFHKNLDRFFEEKSNPAKLPSNPRKASISSDEEDNLPLSQLSTPTKKKPRFRKSKDEATWPRPGQNLWLSVDSKELLDLLMANLCKNGVRESKLLHNLEKNYDSIIKSINKKTALFQHVVEPPTRRIALPSDGDELHRAMAVKHMQALVREACRGGLANLPEPDIFEQRIAVLESVSEFCSALLEIHAAIPPKFLKYYMTGVSDKKKKGAEQVEPDTSDREKVKAERRVTKWRKAVEETTLYSRFCLLHSILHDSIKWELYHYRRPNSRRTASRNKNYADVNDGIDEEEEEEEDEEEIEEVEEDENACRRSSRLRHRRRVKPDQQEGFPERRSRRRAVYRDEGSDPDNDGEEEDAEASEEDSELSGDNDEEQENSSEQGESEKEQEEEIDEPAICRSIIEKLLKYQYSEIFREPVVAEDVPDYYDIITKPICLNDICNKIDGDRGNQGVSTRRASTTFYNFDDLMDDFKLLLDNAALYNTEDSFAMKQAHKLEQAFVRLCRDNFCEPEQHRVLRSLFVRVPR
ncbi:unnamed protein product [Clavelina lepadiformis]|uniref:Bromodomain adjacent to zinc finger domain protein 1A n=1 Tax=Clavelina lepadiformis TaxID=159417 RepID=A0ABP0FA95_CLALP